MSIDKSLAKGLATRSRDEAIAQCKAHVDRFCDVFIEAIRQQSEGARQAKVVRSLLAQVNRICGMPGVIGHVGKIPGHSRKYAYLFVGPNFSESAVFYSLSAGVLDERKPIDDPRHIDVVMMTRHAFERLHQRIDTFDPDRVLVEIASATLPTLKFRRTANMLGLKQWPLPSVTGIFVAVPGTDDDLTTLLTWLPREGLAGKWKTLCDAVDAVPNSRAFSHEPCLELAACLERYEWLRRDYQPPSDDEARFWALPR